VTADAAAAVASATAGPQNLPTLPDLPELTPKKMRVWIENNASPKPHRAILLTMRKTEFLLSTPVPGNRIPAKDDRTTEVQKQISIKKAIGALNEEKTATLRLSEGSEPNQGHT
jgi:hypothetical protein